MTQALARTAVPPRSRTLGKTVQSLDNNIVSTQPRDGDSGYNDELVSQLITLNNKLNLLSPDLVHGDKERAEVQERRESLYAEIKHHRAKGHEGKPCPAARRV
jgi:hypothetical protein